MAFHHGVETIRVDGGTVPVLTTDTAITGVIIASEQGDTFDLKRCVLSKDFEQFGQNDTLDILQRYSAGTHYVVNIGKAEFDAQESSGTGTQTQTETEKETEKETETKTHTEKETEAEAPKPQPKPEFKSANFELTGAKKDEINLPDKSLKDLKVYFKEALIDKSKYKFDAKIGKIKFTQSLLPPAVSFEQRVTIYKYKELFTFNPARAEVKGAKNYTITAPDNQIIKSIVFKGAKPYNSASSISQIITEYKLDKNKKTVKEEIDLDSKTKEFGISKYGNNKNNNEFLATLADDLRSINLEFKNELEASISVHIGYEKLISSNLDVKYHDDGSSLKTEDYFAAQVDYTKLIPEIKNPLIFNNATTTIPDGVFQRSQNYYDFFYRYEDIKKDIILAGSENAFYYYGTFTSKTPFKRNMQETKQKVGFPSGDFTLNPQFNFNFLSQEKDLNKALNITPPAIATLKVEYTTVIPESEKPVVPAKPVKTPEQIERERLEKEQAVRELLGKMSGKDTITKLAPRPNAQTVAKVLLAIKELKQGFIKYGIDAKVVLAPHFDSEPAIASALLDLASQIKARAYIDVDATSLSDALQKRGANSGNLQLSNERALYFFPKCKGANGKEESLATHTAGLRMLTDVERGYWHSSSNQNLKGVVGSVVNLYARPDDIQSETNALNAVGINTVFNSYGTGFRLWGNRSSCYPTVTHIKNFEVALAVGDFIDENIKRVELQYVDKPINQAVVDSLVFSIDTFMRTLPSIAGYKVGLNYKYDLTDAFSKGQIPIVYSYTPILPAERISNESVMTREFLINLIKKD